MFMIWAEYARRMNYPGAHAIHTNSKYVNGDEYVLVSRLPRDYEIAQACGYPLEEDPLSGGLTAPDLSYICLLRIRNKLRAEQAKTEIMRIEKDYAGVKIEHDNWKRQFEARCEKMYQEALGKFKDDPSDAEKEQAKEQALNHPLVVQVAEHLEAAETRLESFKQRHEACRSVMTEEEQQYFVVSMEAMENVNIYGLEMRGKTVTFAPITRPALT